MKRFSLETLLYQAVNYHNWAWANTDYSDELKYIIKSMPPAKTRNLFIYLIEIPPFQHTCEVLITIYFHESPYSDEYINMFAGIVNVPINAGLIGTPDIYKLYKAMKIRGKLDLFYPNSKIENLNTIAREDELQAKIAELTRENEQLRANIDKLSAENAELRLVTAGLRGCKVAI